MPCYRDCAFRIGFDQLQLNITTPEQAQALHRVRHWLGRPGGGGGAGQAAASTSLANVNVMIKLQQSKLLNIVCTETFTRLQRLPMSTSQSTQMQHKHVVCGRGTASSINKHFDLDLRSSS